MQYCDPFKDKKITIMGLGLLGRGVGDAAFLAECGADLIVTDLKSEEELKDSLKQLESFENIKYMLGEHRLEDFRDRDMILKAAGVPLDSPYIEEAKNHNIPVRMSADLLVEHAQVKTVGITGTRGKSTVTHLIAHTLREAGKRVLLGGNVRGVSSLSLLPEVQPDTVLVLELDSWQLQGFGEAKISPNIAVFTNLKQDHLNYYPDEATYFADKANIFTFQKEGDVLIAGRHVADAWIQKANPLVTPKIPEQISSEWELHIIGEHNKENAAFAAEVLRVFDLNPKQIKNGLESFGGVPGRLQFVREVGGVKIYNDNNATTPDAVIAALAALAPEKPVLIMGGRDKGLEFDILAKAVPELVHAIVFLKGTGTDKLLPLLEPLLKSKKIPFLEFNSLNDAVTSAINFAQGRGVVLFSPGFASFGMFTNEYDRNDQFMQLVKKLK